MPNPYKMGGSHTCLHAGFVTHLLAFVLHFCASGVVEVKQIWGRRDIPVVATVPCLCALSAHMWGLKDLNCGVSTDTGDGAREGELSWLKFEKRAHETRLQTVFLFEVPATLLTHQVSLTFPTGCAQHRARSTSGIPSGSPMSSSTATPCHFISHTLFLHFRYTISA